MRLALPFIVVAALFALGAGSGRPASPRDERVTLEVAGVLPIQDDAASLVVLREKGSQTLLPVLMPAPAGRNVAARLRQRGRGGADLLGGALAALGARVEEVELEAATETAHGARVRLRQGGRALELDGLTSEAIALAVGSGAPLVARRALLLADGLGPEDLKQLHERHRSGEDAPLRL
jgi:bifunctional DNase/RNase